MRVLYFGYISPYSRKIRVVLAEKGLEYQAEPTQAAQAPVSFNALNPARRVPALRDGDRALYESNLIIDYLLQTYPETSEGESVPFATALTRAEHHWDDAQILAGIETMLDSGLILLQLRNNGITAEHSEFLGRERSRIDVLLDWLEARATPEGFIPGQFSVQDMNLVISLQWSDYRGMFEWRDRPNIAAIVERYRDRPSMRQTVPELAPA